MYRLDIFLDLLFTNHPFIYTFMILSIDILIFSDYNIFHIIYCNWKVNFFLYLINHYTIVTYGRVVVQFERLLTSNLDMACGIKLTYVLTEYINPLWAKGLSVFVRGFSFFFSQPLYIYRADCTQRTMETDERASSTSESDKPFNSQQKSVNLTRPFLAQVRFSYRSAAK